MNKAVAVQVFSALAIVVGLAVSYYPPESNGAAIWALVGGFLGYAARDLFSEHVRPVDPPAGGEAGFASPVLLAMMAAGTLALAGCSSLTGAGMAEYSVKPFVDSAGALHCCEVMVRNGKEYAMLKAHIAKSGDGYSVDLEEHAVSAFRGQVIAAGAQQAAIGQAAKVAGAAALAPALPALLPAAGAALAAPGLGAAAVGAAAGIGASNMLSAPAGASLRVPQ